MAEANHYCADCGTHFRADPETHARVEHDGGFFRGVIDGNYKDWQRKQQHREDIVDGDMR